MNRAAAAQPMAPHDRQHRISCVRAHADHGDHSPRTEPLRAAIGDSARDSRQDLPLAGSVGVARLSRLLHAASVIVTVGFPGGWSRMS
jgi:hypothetical protein